MPHALQALPIDSPPYPHELSTSTPHPTPPRLIVKLIQEYTRTLL